MFCSRIYLSACHWGNGCQAVLHFGHLGLPSEQSGQKIDPHCLHGRAIESDNSEPHSMHLRVTFCSGAICFHINAPTPTAAKAAMLKRKINVCIVICGESVTSSVSPSQAMNQGLARHEHEQSRLRAYRISICVFQNASEFFCTEWLLNQVVGPQLKHAYP